MRGQHSNKFDLQMLATISALSKRPPDSVPASACIFCDWEQKIRNLDPAAHDSDSTLVVLPRKFEKHVGSHMEALALFAISPRNEQQTEVGSAVAVPHLDSERQTLSSFSINENGDRRTLSLVNEHDYESPEARVEPVISRNDPTIPDIEGLQTPVHAASNEDDRNFVVDQGTHLNAQEQNSLDGLQAAPAQRDNETGQSRSDLDTM